MNLIDYTIEKHNTGRFFVRFEDSISWGGLWSATWLVPGLVPGVAFVRGALRGLPR